MDQKMQKIIDDLKEVKLSGAEKALLKASITQKMAEMPALHKKRVPSPYFTWFQFSSRQVQLVLASFLIVALFGSGVAFAANQALPGDILYPVKIGVNEKVARVFHKASSVSEALFETQLMDERLNEAEKLADSKKLEGNLREEVKTEVTDQTNRAEKAVERANEQKLEKTSVEPDKKQEIATTTNISSKNEKQDTNENVNIKKPDTQKQDSNENVTDTNNNGAENADDAIRSVFEKHQKIIQELKVNQGESHSSGSNGKNLKK